MSREFLFDHITHDDWRFQALGGKAWEQFDRVLAPLATVRLTPSRQIIQRIPYDMVIVAEGYHLLNRATVSWRFVNPLQKKCELELTATRVQNKLDELHNLITVLKPGQLKRERQSKYQFVVRGDRRSPKNRGLLRELLADVMVRNTHARVDIQLPLRRTCPIRSNHGPKERSLCDGGQQLRSRGVPVGIRWSAEVHPEYTAAGDGLRRDSGTPHTGEGVQQARPQSATRN